MTGNDHGGMLGGATGRTGLLGRILGAVIGAVVLVGALLFSAVVFSFLLAAGVLVGGYLWWRTRELRKQLREQMARMEQQMREAGQSPSDNGSSTAPGTVLEGDFIRERQDKPGQGSA
ncbi:MAG: hypothetical protein VW257_05445 [Quisquiliibacterium sp.]